MPMVKNERAAVEMNWEGNGKFEAVIVNGELKHFMGVVPNGSVDLYTNDYKFLLQLRDNITELEAEVKGQQARMGRNGALKAISNTAPSAS